MDESISKGDFEDEECGWYIFVGEKLRKQMNSKKQEEQLISEKL